MPKYNVRSPIKWKGARISEGEVEMPEKIAQPLLEAGTLEPAAASCEAPAKAGKAEAKK